MTISRSPTAIVAARSLDSGGTWPSRRNRSPTQRITDTRPNGSSLLASSSPDAMSNLRSVIFVPASAPRCSASIANTRPAPDASRPACQSGGHDTMPPIWSGRSCSQTRHAVGAGKGATAGRPTLHRGASRTFRGLSRNAPRSRSQTNSSAFRAPTQGVTFW